MAGESSPLLPAVELKIHELPAGGTLHWVMRIPLVALRHHWLGVCAASASAVVCWLLGWSDKVVIDQLVFKTVLIMVGFVMGFRNTNANQRRIQTMHHVHRLTAGFWGIYTTLPPALRHKFGRPLVDALGAIIDQLCVASSRRTYWFGVVSLRPASSRVKEESKGPVPCEDSCEVTFSPRSFLVNTLLACEEDLKLAEGDHVNPAQLSLVRNLWLHKQLMLSSYDDLVACTVPAVGNRYLAFMDMCLVLFLMAFPYGIKAEPTSLGRFTVGPLGILLVDTLFCSFVMYSLEAMTRENEIPLRHAQEEDDLDLRSLREIHTIATAGYDARLLAAERLVPASPGPVPDSLDLLRRHALACGLLVTLADGKMGTERGDYGAFYVPTDGAAVC